MYFSTYISRLQCRHIFRRVILCKWADPYPEKNESEAVPIKNMAAQWIPNVDVFFDSVVRVIHGAKSQSSIHRFGHIFLQTVDTYIASGDKYWHFDIYIWLWAYISKFEHIYWHFDILILFDKHRWANDAVARGRLVSLTRFSFAFRAKKGMTLIFASPALDGAIRRKQSNMFVSPKSKEKICWLCAKGVRNKDEIKRKLIIISISSRRLGSGSLVILLWTNTSCRKLCW